MTEPDLTPAEGDTAGPFATPAQDADVRALLGTLRAEDVPMPDDVVRRINAAVVAERVASTLPDSPAALVDESDAATDHGSVTVLPSPEERRGPSYGGLKRILAIAAAAVVVLAGGAAIRSVGLLAGGGSSTSGGASAVPEAADAGGSTGNGTSSLTSGKVTDSGTAYAVTSLKTQAQALVQGRTPAPVTAPVPSGSVRSSAAYAAPVGTVLDRCVTALTGRSGVTPLAVDSGTLGGQPALVLVLPTDGDAQSLDVWVVAPGCGTGGEPDLITFQRIPRP
ncbi:MAG TPA: hypothetical protein VFL59_09940 [Candidatus Nanopelagicales bacterium]|nr:hypothetical protein [Candidatus Nanopelagicales bacterium]